MVPAAYSKPPYNRSASHPAITSSAQKWGTDGVSAGDEADVAAVIGDQWRDGQVGLHGGFGDGVGRQERVVAGVNDERGCRDRRDELSCSSFVCSSRRRRRSHAAVRWPRRRTPRRSSPRKVRFEIDERLRVHLFLPRTLTLRERRSRPTYRCANPRSMYRAPAARSKGTDHAAAASRPAAGPLSPRYLSNTLPPREMPTAARRQLGVLVAQPVNDPAQIRGLTRVVEAKAFVELTGARAEVETDAGDAVTEQTTVDLVGIAGVGRALESVK